MKFLCKNIMNSVVFVLLTAVITGNGFVARQRMESNQEKLSRMDSDEGCPSGKHIDCFKQGHVTNRTDCRNHGCFWCPKYGRSGPWCVSVGAECSVSPRQDCFPTGSEIDRIQCRSKGCHWCPGDPTMFRDEPWCVTGKRRGLLSDIVPKGNPICPNGQIIRYKQHDSCCNVTEDLSCGHVPSQGRIVGGSISSRGIWPWMIYFEPFVRATCGATLISPTLALTAGHCVSGFNIFDMSVKLGIIDLEYPKIDSMITRKIRRYAVHPNYTVDPSVSSDVAILEFTEAVEYSHYIQPICLPQNEKPPVGSICFVAGWGAETYVGDISKRLQEVGIYILRDSDCRNYGSMYKPSHMICAGHMDGSADSCLGDSGGPLMCQRCSSCQWYLAGIVSFGMDCALPGFPGVYSKLATFEDWLEGEGVPTIKENISC